MSSTKSSGAGIAVCTPVSDRLHRAAAGPMSAGDVFAPGFGSMAETMEPGRTGQSLMGYADLSPAEFNELSLFEEFMEQHVQQNGICDVQCMLLWSEWVRAFRRKSPGFPSLIREKEFRIAILDAFNIGIATDAFRGLVYSGIKFVP